MSSQKLTYEKLKHNQWLLTGVVFYFSMIVIWRWGNGCLFTSYDCYTYYFPMLELFQKGASFSQWNHPICPPLLIIAQGGIMTLFHISNFELAALLLNGLLMIPCTYIVFCIATTISQNKLSGGIAAMLLLINPIIAWRSLTTGNELIYATLLSAFCLSLIRYCNSTSCKSFIATSLFAILLALVRAEGPIWSVVFIACLGVINLRKKQKAQLCLSLISFCILFAMCAGPRLGYMKKTTGLYLLDIRQNIGHVFSKKNSFDFETYRQQYGFKNAIYTDVNKSAFSKYQAKSSAYMTPWRRVAWSVRGFVIGVVPLGLYLLLCLYQYYKSRLTKEKVKLSSLLKKNTTNACILTSLLIVIQCSILIIVLFLEPRYMSLILPLVSALIAGLFTITLSRFQIVVFLLLSTIWSHTVLYKIPQRKHELHAGTVLSQLHSPRQSGIVLSHSPGPAFYANLKWCPVPDFQGRRYILSEDEILEMCRTANIEFILAPGCPYWDIHQWHEPFTPDFNTAWYASLIPVKNDTHYPTLVINAKKLVKMCDRPTGHFEVINVENSITTIPDKTNLMPSAVDD